MRATEASHSVTAALPCGPSIAANRGTRDSRVLTRLLVGAILALAIAVTGARSGSLSTSGVMAAVLVGAGASAAGWEWAALLIAFFVVTSALPHLIPPRSTAALAAAESIVEKAGARDAAQVLANGGVFALLSLLATGRPSHLAVAAAGALAAAAADSWSTEIGTRWGSAPRSILTWMPMAVGTSGAVTTEGFAGTVAGAVFIAALAAAIAGASFWCVMAGGIAGAIADSLVGATVQTRRWCGRCGTSTERRIHTCGATTRVNGGISWLDNDVVNVLCTIVGAAVAFMCAGL